jgi:hypothetical protein
MIPPRKCAICGSIGTYDKGLCVNMCRWTLEGWLGWNGRTKKQVMNSRVPAVLLTLSYPKKVALARLLGWTGNENHTMTVI